jgi:glycosyltransferase involved in cell wall biosynthesis
MTNVQTQVEATFAKSSCAEALAPIAAPYLLVIHVPCFQRNARRWAEPLWEKDLREHLRYLSNLTLAAPLKTGPAPPDAVPIEAPPGCSAPRHVDLSATRTVRHHIFFLPADLFRLWKAIGKSQIVQIGVCGWPIPLGWFAGPMAKLRGKLLVVIIESAPWTVPSTKWRMRLLNAITAWMAPKLTRAADLAIYTQDQYRVDFPPRDATLGHVTPASWIDEEIILSDEQAAAAWHAKPKDTLRLAFFGRLIEQKGISELISAMRQVSQLEKKVTLDVYGQGKLETSCIQAARDLPAHIQVCGFLPYGPEFFATIRKYHAVVVPGTATEQPRILYDANSQAVPILGTATDGNRQVITDGVNGWLTTVGDIDALTALIRKAAHDISALRHLGINGLATARGFTHREMHRRRWVLLQEMISRA